MSHEKVYGICEDKCRVEVNGIFKIAKLGSTEKLLMSTKEAEGWITKIPLPKSGLYLCLLELTLMGRGDYILNVFTSAQDESQYHRMFTLNPYYTENEQDTSYQANNLIQCIPFVFCISVLDNDLNMTIDLSNQKGNDRTYINLAMSRMTLIKLK